MILKQSKPFAGWMPLVLTATLASMLGLMFCLPGFAGAHFRTTQSWAQEEADRARVGRWLAENSLPGDSVMLKPAGIIPYYSGLTAYDVYSLADRRAAQTGTWVPQNWAGHQRVSVSRLLDLDPSWVILDEHLYAEGDLPDPNAGNGVVERAWREDARHAGFTPLRAEIEPNRWLQYFRKKP